MSLGQYSSATAGWDPYCDRATSTPMVAVADYTWQLELDLDAGMTFMLENRGAQLGYSGELSTHTHIYIIYHL